MIAHELERLIDDLRGQPDSRGGRRPPSVEASCLQLRDVFESLVKVSTIVLLRGVIEAGGDGEVWARRNRFPAHASLGTWVDLLRSASVYARNLPRPLAAIAEGWLGKPLEAVRDFAMVRNDLLGHGVRALDPRDAANTIAGICLDGRYRTTRKEKEERQIGTLAGIFEALVRLKAFEGCRWVARRNAEEIDLTGAGAATNWLANPLHNGHDGEVLPVVMRWNGTALSLSPFIAARICHQCGRRDVLAFDGLYDADKGESSTCWTTHEATNRRHEGERSARPVETFDRKTIVVPEIREGDSLKYQTVLEALDKARVDRQIVPPRYSWEAFFKFLTSCDRGVFWLTAPAHVGKTTFVQGLAQVDTEEFGIDPRFAQRKRPIVTYLCRKEYRTGATGMVNALTNRLTEISMSVNMPTTCVPTREGSPRQARARVHRSSPTGWPNGWPFCAATGLSARPSRSLWRSMVWTSKSRPPDRRRCGCCHHLKWFPGISTFC